jgi:Ca-activated chloride channel family protein
MKIEVKMGKGIIPKGKNAHDMVLCIMEGVQKKSNQKKKRMPVNLALAIDVSGSMSETVYQHTIPAPLITEPLSPMFNQAPVVAGWPVQQPGVYPFDQQPRVWNHMPAVHHVKVSKLDLVKQAIREAVSLLNEKDRVALVTFETEAKCVMPSLQMTPENKEKLLAAVNALIPLSSTNLYGGWLEAAKEVASHLSDTAVNRVLLLTDGFANVGIVDPGRIRDDVSGLCVKKISTTTFGVGASFNEDLLQDIATSGAGNAYFLNKQEEYGAYFKQEFEGASMVVAQQVTMTVQSEKGVSFEMSHMYEEKEGVWILPNVKASQSVQALCKVAVDKLSTQKIKRGEAMRLGTITIAWNDDKGQVNQHQVVLEAKVGSQQEVDAAMVDEQVSSCEVLLDIAKCKKEAADLVKSGHREDAVGVLRACAAMASASNLDAVKQESGRIEATLIGSMNDSAQVFSKTLQYDSYGAMRSS